MNSGSRSAIAAVSWTAAFIVILILVAIGVFLLPKYSAYKIELDGQAQIRLAQLRSKMALEDAKNSLELAKLNSQAEIESARGHAEAIRLVGQALANNQGYLSYQWLQRMQSPTSEVIYVPTEAQMPIMEATRNLQRALTTATTTAPPR